MSQAGAWLLPGGLAIMMAFGGLHPLPSRDTASTTITVMTGGVTTHVVQPGESLTSIGARAGVEASTLARDNGIGRNATLKAGQILRLDNRHVPPLVEDGIVINIPQRMLFYVEAGQPVVSYPVGLGRPSWPTPIGQFTIAAKELNPVWDVPASIQDEMRRQGKPVVIQMPPCPENPLGDRWLALSRGAFGIHGTNAVTSIFHFGTHGCIRLHPDDIEDLFDRVTVGVRVSIVYEPVILARVGGRFYLEAHRDPYRRASDPIGRLAKLIATFEDPGLIDGYLAGIVARAREGVARDVTR